MILLCVAFVFACSAPDLRTSRVTGVYHIVKKGETAYSISRAYSITLDELAEINNLEDAALIREGQVLFIPDADQVIEDVMVAAQVSGPQPGRKETPSVGEKKPPAQRPVEKSPPAAAGPVHRDNPPPPQQVPLPNPVPKASSSDVAAAKGKLDWPLRGAVTTKFGLQPDKTYHNWIRIACPDDAPVAAAAEGTVIFSAALKDYGETIIIRHEGNLATVYTHLQKRTVQTDQSVKKGQIIGAAGVKDASGLTFIHFEVRLKGKARNPIFYLP